MSLDIDFYFVNKDKTYNENVRFLFNESVFWSRDYQMLYEITEEYGEEVEGYGGVETYRLKDGLNTFIILLKNSFENDKIKPDDYIELKSKINFVKKILFLELDVYVKISC